MAGYYSNREKCGNGYSTLACNSPSPFTTPIPRPSSLFCSCIFLSHHSLFFKLYQSTGECHDICNGSRNTQSVRTLSSGVLLEPLLMSTVFSPLFIPTSATESRPIHSVSTRPSSANFVLQISPLRRTPSAHHPHDS